MTLENTAPSFGSCSLENTKKSLEKEFLESLEKNTLILQVGCRHSGKTTFACSLLRHLLLHSKFYEEFHLVLPTYESGQQGGTFDWIDDLPEKLKKKITIYCEFSLVIVEKLIDASDGETNRFLYVDDATAEVALFSNDATLKSLSTKARHYRITTFLCFHFLKRSLSTQLRNSAEWLLLHRATDMRLLAGIWEECCSLFYEQRPFMEMVREEMFKDFPCIAIWRDKGKLDCGNPMDWDIQIKNREKVLKPKKRNKDIDNIKDGTPDKASTSQIKRTNDTTTYRGLKPEIQKSKGRKVIVTLSSAKFSKR